MRRILITFIDERVKEFRSQWRPGGSYTLTLKLEPGWVKVEDEWGNLSIFPADKVKEIKAEE